MKVIEMATEINFLLFNFQNNLPFNGAKKS